MFPLWEMLREKISTPKSTPLSLVIQALQTNEYFANVFLGDTFWGDKKKHLLSEKMTDDGPKNISQKTNGAGAGRNTVASSAVSVSLNQAQPDDSSTKCRTMTGPSFASKINRKCCFFSRQHSLAEVVNCGCWTMSV